MCAAKLNQYHLPEETDYHHFPQTRGQLPRVFTNSCSPSNEILRSMNTSLHLSSCLHQAFESQQSNKRRNVSELLPQVAVR